MNITRVLDIATKTGQIMLESGAETYRVEETIKTIAGHFGYEISSYATLTGIISTIKDKENNLITNTLRINKRTMNLDKIHKIYELSRNIENFNLEDFDKRLFEIEKEEVYSSKTNLIAFSLSAGSFTLLFGGNIRDFFGSAIIGIVIYLYINFLSPYDINKFFINGLGSAIIALLGVLFSKFSLISSRDLTIIGSMMLLVPGMALTNSLRDIINGDLMAGMARGLEAFFIATSLAVGSGFILTIFR